MRCHVERCPLVEAGLAYLYPVRVRIAGRNHLCPVFKPALGILHVGSGKQELSKRPAKEVGLAGAVRNVVPQLVGLCLRRKRRLFYGEIGQPVKLYRVLLDAKIVGPVAGVPGSAGRQQAVEGKAVGKDLRQASVRVKTHFNGGLEAVFGAVEAAKIICLVAASGLVLAY